MRIIISSGNGVDEVCRALWHFLNHIEGRYRYEVVGREYARCDDGYRSITLESDDAGLIALQGTLLWRSPSPFRPRHKRKNWYFTLTVYPEDTPITIDENAVIYQTMKSPKKGGQHVNTTASGVRAIYPPLGLEALSYDERSQHRNKRIALSRLIAKANAQSAAHQATRQNKQWRAGKQIERGNAVRVFEGEEFREVNQ